MLQSFVPLLKLSRLMQLGLLGIVAGLGLLIWAGSNKIPARAELKKVSGVLAEGKQITKTTKRRGQSSGTMRSVYELGVRQANGQIRTLNLDGAWVQRDKIEAVMLRPVEVEVDEGDNVLVLSGNGQPILTYETSVKDYAIDNKRYSDIGAPMLIFGLPLLLIGWFWKRRSVANAAARQAAA